MKALIQISVNELRQIVAEMLSKELNTVVSPGIIQIDYSGRYDDIEFAGLSLEVNLDDLNPRSTK